MVSENEHTGKNSLAGTIVLRDIISSDLAIFFEHQTDPEANYMAAFTAEDPLNRDAFEKKWDKILADKNIRIQTIVYWNQVAGNIMFHRWFGDPEVSYWIDRQYWGKGIATQALDLFLKQITTRPLFARVVQDNTGSIRVLEKCGFRPFAEDKGYANARGKEVVELIFKLD